MFGVDALPQQQGGYPNNNQNNNNNNYNQNQYNRVQPLPNRQLQYNQQQQAVSIKSRYIYITNNIKLTAGILSKSNSKFYNENWKIL